MTRIFISLTSLAMAAATASAVTIAHRYSFSGDLTDSVGGVDGVLQGAASVSGSQLILPGGGTGPGADAMRFSSTIDIGANFGATGVTIETWYTDGGSGTWAKLFTFGTSAVGPEFAFTNVRGNTGFSGLDRNGNHDLPFRPSIGDEHHLVIALAADGTTNLWLDGGQVFNGVATNPVSNIVSTHEAIGATAWGDPGHLGSVNEFRIYSGADITTLDVQNALAAGPNGHLLPEPGILALFGLGSLCFFRRRR